MDLRNRSSAYLLAFVKLIKSDPEDVIFIWLRYRQWKYDDMSLKELEQEWTRTESIGVSKLMQIDFYTNKGGWKT